MLPIMAATYPVVYVMLLFAAMGRLVLTNKDDNLSGSASLTVSSTISAGDTITATWNGNLLSKYINLGSYIQVYLAAVANNKVNLELGDFQAQCMTRNSGRATDVTNTYIASTGTLICRPLQHAWHHSPR